MDDYGQMDERKLKRKSCEKKNMKWKRSLMYLYHIQYTSS